VYSNDVTSDSTTKPDFSYTRGDKLEYTAWIKSM